MRIVIIGVVLFMVYYILHQTAYADILTTDDGHATITTHFHRSHNGTIVIDNQDYKMRPWIFRSEDYQSPSVSIGQIVADHWKNLP